MRPVIWTSPSLDRPAGRTLPITWTAFAERVKSPRPAATKDGLARWAPVQFRASYRARANIVACYAVVLDVDDGAPLDHITSGLDGLFAIVHSTFSATPTHPRWRVVVPLDQPVNADEYDRCWRWIASAVEDSSFAPDYQGRDAPHAWAVPAVHPSNYYVTHVGEGSFACVADALTAIPAPEPPAMVRRAPEESYDRSVERARRYLEKCPPSIQGSGGSSACMWAANALVRGFSLDTDDALAILVQDFNPRCLPPWSIPELRHKVQQAITRSKQPFGFLSERRRSA
jgi:hypothetical protein